VVVRKDQGDGYLFTYATRIILVTNAYSSDVVRAYSREESLHPRASLFLTVMSAYAKVDELIVLDN